MLGYTEQAAASMARISVNELRELVKQRKVRRFMVEGRIYFNKADIRALRDVNRPMVQVRADQAIKARERGHVVVREHAERNPGETATSRVVCSCGWASLWLVNSDATVEKRAHLKQAAVAPDTP